MEDKKEKLLLHVCCAPCSSYVLELLEQQYEITAFFYNPNITEKEEYEKRVAELRRFTKEALFAQEVTVQEGSYEPALFFEMARGLEKEPERGKRCYKCYELRMREPMRRRMDLICLRQLCPSVRIKMLHGSMRLANGWQMSLKSVICTVILKRKMAMHAP